MAGKKYTVGLDFGSLSGRAVLVDVKTGEEVAVSVFDYPHGVMDEYLPGGGRKLPENYALQHPQDYIDVLSHTIPEIFRQTGVSSGDVIGVGIDFTSCTILPVTDDGTPLCFMEEYRSDPHAYAKLWKHHAAQDKANRLNEIAAKRGEPWLKRYGGKISSEWSIPKIWQILDEDPALYKKIGKFVDGGDFIVWQLTGTATRSESTAGYKACWSRQQGYPSKEFFAALDPRLANLTEEKFIKNFVTVGDVAGTINEYGAKLTGLRVGTPVATANIDAHVAAPALKMSRSGQVLMIMGTSTCHLMLGTEEKDVPGICGVVEDGAVPGCFGYEAGQACVGDHFAWFVENCVPADYREDAKKQGVNIHKYLRKKASALKPGESGLVALDWWNGNRSVLVDVDLTGMMVGMTLHTRPEEIYRALIEATAYGTRMILENYVQNGMPIDEVFAAGGIAEKDELMMQIYADVVNKKIRISGSSQAPALGSAIFAALAAGKKAGGYDTIAEASDAMGKLRDTVYIPNPENVKTYDKLYAEYKILHDYFGRGENNAMKRLLALKKEVKK